MSDDEETPPDQGFRGPPLPPDDRLWRHPSELTGRGPRRRRALRPLASLGLAAGLGASAALLAAWGLGAFAAENGDHPARERVAGPVSTLLVGGSMPGGVDDVVAAMVAVQAGGTHGSGVVLRDDGHVVTTADLVGDHDPVMVRSVDGPDLEGEVVGVDRATDVAVLRVPDLDLAGAVLGAAAEVDVGAPTRAVVLGDLDTPQVVTGVVANLAVTVTRRDEAPLHGLIGTDIVLTGAREGAALVDAAGSVIGITTAIGGTDVVRAVPIDLARAVADDIIATGAAAHPWLGIRGRDLDTAIAAEWGVRGGAELAEVVGGSPADVAGLRPADVVTQVDDTEVTSLGDLVTALRHRDPGDEVRIGYLRGGTHDWCDAVLAEPA